MPVGGLEHLLSVAAGVSILYYFWCSITTEGALIMQFDTTGLEGYITNEDAESNSGVWVPFPGDREFRVLRAGGSNKWFLRAHQAALKPYKRRLDKGNMDSDVLERIARHVYSRHIVKDWRGIKDSDGAKIPFSPDACEAFFEAFPEVFTDIVMITSDMATFANAEIEEAQEELGED